MQGQGQLYYQSGKIAYNGSWFDDHFEGYGVLYNEYPKQLNDLLDYSNLDMIDEYWTLHDGQFKYDMKEGFGTLSLSNGEKIIGFFKNDLMDGSGTYFTRDGRRINGFWSQNKLVKQQ